MMDMEEVIKKMNTKMIVGWVVAVAAVNWGLVGLLNVNLVEVIFGSSVLAKAVYILIGLAGVYKLYNLTLAKK